MAVRRLADEQPQSFEFTPDNLAWAKRKISDYPDGRQVSAVIPILWRAQEQHHGWLPEPAIRLVSDMLDMPYIRALEIATFYTMFQLKPVGTVAHVNVCGTTPCMLRGAGEIVDICKARIAAHPSALSEDGRFSWEEVECAGACVNAPMVQIGAETYEDLTPDRFNALLDTLANGGTPTPGPQSSRRASEPVSGATSLLTDVTVTPAGSEETAKQPASDEAAATQATKAEQSETSTPPKGIDPATPTAEDENAARPKSNGRAEVAAARSGGGEEDGKPTPEAADNKPGKRAARDKGVDKVASERADAEGKRPDELERSAVPTVDNLQKISGIGPVIERRLHDLGIFTFAQVAAWDDSNKAWVNAYLAFKGRIDRERWVEQAKEIVNEASEG